MDGYALRASDTDPAPCLLDVIGQVRAGAWSDAELRPGQAIQVMTGAPVPAGTTAVQPVEKTRRIGDTQVEILAPVAAGAHIARQGCEVRQGDVVLGRGETIDPALIAVLATVGCARVRVGTRPTLSLLVTGDELVDVAEAPGRSQIRNSNGPVVAAQARQAGARVHTLGVAPDRADVLAEAIARGLDSDVLVVSGGVSEGVFDLVEDVLAHFDVRLLFTKVAIKPGAPLVFGVRGRQLVFGLPGNPVSAQVTFDVFVRAALLKMQGRRVLARPTLEAVLGAAVSNRSGRKAHLPALLRAEGGVLLAWPLRSMGSADIVAHARANALVVLEAERTRAEAGERVPCLLLGGFLDRDGAA
jgi:molybdopterin molybdotransferase